MTRRVVHVATALVLSAGLIGTSLVANAAPQPRAVVAKIKENAALAPKYDPAQPVMLDEFAPNANVHSIHFDFDRATVRPGDAKILDSNARWLKANPPYEIVIEGYADERGAKPYNAALAKRRAMTVRNQLVARGIDPDRIVTVSYGEARPECHDKKMKHDACWSKNRRADILVRQAGPQNP